MAETKTKKWPWMRILLVASLALNLLFVGLVDGVFEVFDRFGGLTPRGAALGQNDVELGRDLIDQQVPSRLGKFLERVRVHQTITFLPARICSSRVFFIASTYCSTSASSVR